MSARKTRPERGTQVVAGMSKRDIAAALGTSTAWLHRCIALGELGDAEFNRRLSACTEKPNAQAILKMGSPVPVRGRVERAFEIIKKMSDAEFTQLVCLLNQGGEHA